MNRQHRIELPLSAWPATDRAAWQDLFRAGDILDGQGAAVHWAEATRRTNAKHYARWLGWLVANDFMDGDLAPWERVAPARVEAYGHHASWKPSCRWTETARLSICGCFFSDEPTTPPSRNAHRISAHRDA
jgi:hypothetical protein